MDNLFSATFEAHDFAMNHHRRYELVVGRDLLGAWTLTIGFGRTGKRGSEQRFAFAEVEVMQRVIRDRLRRRLSAPRRIGCSYRLCRVSAAPGIDASVWLPAEMIGEFSAVQHFTA